MSSTADLQNEDARWIVSSGHQFPPPTGSADGVVVDLPDAELSVGDLIHLTRVTSQAPVDNDKTNVETRSRLSVVTPSDQMTLTIRRSLLT